MIKNPVYDAVRRIEEMERCFDRLCALLEDDDAPAGEAADLLRSLRAYYEGGQWLRDYELDESGLLPRDLKRGVLSQDGVHALLARFMA